MNDEAIRVEFRLPPTRKEPAAKPEPGARAERWRQEKVARLGRNLALAHYIDSLIRSGDVVDLAAVARLCDVSRARVSKIAELKGMAAGEQERILGLLRLSNPGHTAVVGADTPLKYNLGQSSR